MGSAMRAGSNEPDGVLSYQVGPRLPPLPGAQPPHPLPTLLSLPPSRGSAGHSLRARGGQLGTPGGARGARGSGPGCEWVTLGQKGEPHPLRGRLRSPDGPRPVTSVLLGSSLLGKRLASGLAVSCWNGGERVARDLALVRHVSLCFSFRGFLVPHWLRGRAGKDLRLRPNPKPCQCGQLYDSLHPVAQPAVKFWIGKWKWAGEVLRGQEQVFI